MNNCYFRSCVYVCVCSREHVRDREKEEKKRIEVGV